MSNASPPLMKIDACVRCGKEKVAYNHLPGQKIPIWSSVGVSVVDPITGKTQEYTRILCPDCGKAGLMTEDVRRLVEEEFAAISKA
ncbi:hypothetical protein MEBOL_004806 [Melittangium boletus DSM 14713]|uniref:Uncharacterized protein n=1 Tax=Melittangium boletus DSM 14713 TaxID=1294270 RepID=A0A250IHP9_9BACT|nr:hypothetical protein MEBOL_004806 [Melittangium boletus DSM 14713]